MLAGFRTFAKSPLAVVLFGLLIVSFAVFGISDVFKGPRISGVVAAGSRSISPDDFKARYENYRKGTERQTGEALTPDQAVERGIDRQILQEVALQESVAEVIRKFGIHPSDKLVGNIVREQMSNLPPTQRPFDPITGKFDPKMYQAVLAQAGLTPDSYQASLSDEIAQSHVFSSVGNGLHAPRIYAALQAAYGLESRDVAVFAINPATVERPANPTDAQLVAFMKEHADRLTRPETRVLSIMRVSAQALEPSVAVDQAEVQKTFNFRKDTLATPETRSIVQIVAPDAKAAGVIAQRLAKGDQPAVVASAYGRQPVMIADKPKSALPDRKVADAAFSLAVGQASGPITGDLGVSVIKVLKITPGTAATLESVRPQIEAELRAQNAQSKAYDQTQTYQDAHDAGVGPDRRRHQGRRHGDDHGSDHRPGRRRNRSSAARPDPRRAQDRLRPVLGRRERADRDRQGRILRREGREGHSRRPAAAGLDQAAADPGVAAERDGQAHAGQGRRPGRPRQEGREPGRRRRLGRNQGPAHRRHQPRERPAASGPGPRAADGQLRRQAGRGLHLARRPGGHRGRQAGGRASGRRHPDGPHHPGPAPTIDQGLMRDLGETVRQAAKASLKTKTNLTLARQAIGVDTDALAKAEAAKTGKAK
jgi:peptidyl-prolyl cis-trans isomerase D